MLNEKEIFYIKKFDTLNNGFNSTTGGSNYNKIYLSSEDKENDMATVFLFHIILPSAVKKPNQ